MKKKKTYKSPKIKVVNLKAFTKLLSDSEDGLILNYNASEKEFFA